MPYKDKTKQTQYQLDWVKRRREAWIQANGPCKSCGSTEGLEVDHVDPSTKITHMVWCWSTERREVELAKCQVLCAPCHKAKTREQLLQKKHGVTATLYRNGCRCELCRDAQARRAREYRERLRACKTKN